MNKIELLEKINHVAQERDEQQKRAKNAKEAQWQSCVQQIKELAPRINTMIEVGQQMYRKRIYIGEKDYSIIGTGSSLVSKCSKSYRVGFATVKGLTKDPYWTRFDDRTICPKAIGCTEEILIDVNGDIIFGFPDKFRSLERAIWWANNVLQNFDDFEKKFFEYVESL